MKLRWTWALLACLVGVSGCGSDREEGGGGFGGETISGRVVGASGAPVVGAVVRARTFRSLDGAALAQARTDGSGCFSMEGVPQTALRLEVEGMEGSNSVFALLEHDPGHPAREVVARPARARTVRIRDEAGSGIAATLQAYGLGAVASTDDAGVVRLSHWPDADLWVRVIPRDGAGAVDVFVPRGDTAVDVVPGGWLVDDFEGETTRTRLGLLLGGGWWYAASAGTTRDQDGANVSQEVFGHGYDTTSSHGGRASLHVSFAFSPEKSDRYGLVGFHLGVVDGQAVDLSGMDSLVFWLKGNGPVRVDLVVREGDRKRVYAKSVVPSGDWGRFRLRLTDFAPVDGGSDWPHAATSALYLQFSVYQDAEFRLDDLRLFAKRLP